MPFGDLWNRTLVYFGIAEEDDDWDEDSYEEEERAAQRRAEKPNVRRLTPRARPTADEWTDSDPATAISPAPPVRAARPRSRPRPVVEAVPAGNSGAVKVHLVLPRSFNDAQQIADKFKQSIPVILNLQNADTELSKRLIDFASGLTYALDGGMQRVADKVFLLTPRNVEVSAEERARLLEGGGFFNQA
jgi:cell division inhibitor SepF